MIVAALAPLLLVSLGQPPSDYQPVPAPSYQQEDDVVGQPDPYEAADQAAEEADEAAEAAAEAVEEAADAVEAEADAAEAAADRAEASDEEAEQYEAEVCRRVHYVDDFGRQRSRKSCRPR